MNQGSGQLGERILIIGGVARSLINFRAPLLRALVRAGHEVHGAASAASPSILKELDGLGVRFHELHLARTGGNPFQDLATLRSIRRLYEAIRPDVVLAYTAKPVLYSALAAPRRGPRVAALITGLGYAFSGNSLRHRALRVLLERMYRLALARTTVVFFQNDDDRDLFLRRGMLARRRYNRLSVAKYDRSSTKSGPELVTINGSGVDLEQFPQVPVSTKGHFLLLARLIREKGIEDYANAAALVRAQFPKLRFRLAGALDVGPSAIRESVLRRWEQDLGIEYLGLLSDVRPALRDCTVYVLPSYYREGVPRSILEAMAVGRAIITTDVPGCRVTVEPGRNGFLVPARNPEALARAMMRFAQDPALAHTMGGESRRFAEERFDAEDVSRFIIEGLRLPMGAK